MRMLGHDEFIIHQRRAYPTAEPRKPSDRVGNACMAVSGFIIVYMAAQFLRLAV